jgi:hypothetical protein
MDIALFWSISWCTGDCEKHPDVRRVLGKIAAVTGVPKQHYESFQASQSSPDRILYIASDLGRLPHDSDADAVGSEIRDRAKIQCSSRLRK